jgi:curli biogenesis system outer membrane secretion channel CsgG
MNNIRQITLFLLSAFLFLGCATATSYTKPGIDFSNYRKCAITQLDCASNPSVGQEVSDTIAIEFIRKGFNIIERSQLEAILEEEKLRQVGLLREPTKEALLLSGIDSIVVGAVGSYYCAPSSVPIFFMGKILGVMPTNNCHASISLKMLDVRTGDILWAANGSHSKNGTNMTANKVLQVLLRRFSYEIPSP